MFARGTHRRATHKHKTMILPQKPIAVLCDINEAWELKEELRQAGVPCLYGEERVFKASYKLVPFIGLLWMAEVVCSLMKHNAALAVPMPEFRAAFGLPTQPQL